MIKSNFEWNGDKAYQSVIDAGWEGIRRAALYYWERLQIALNVPNSGEDWPIVSEGKDGSTKVLGSRRAYPNASKPGEPPRKVTGFGAGNTYYEFEENRLTARVGLAKNAHYLAILEMGDPSSVVIKPKSAKALLVPDKDNKRWVFRKQVKRGPIAKRPWMLATLKKFYQQIKTMAGVGAEK